MYNFMKTDEQRDRHELLTKLVKPFLARAASYDQAGTFPFENFADLKEAGILALTIPTEYGGEGISLYDMLQVQETIAQGDGATALCLGWHLGILMNLREQRNWPEAVFAEVCQDIVQHQKLINAAQTEPKTGSPTRGGKPETAAIKQADGGWLLNGKKTYTSLAPALDYFIVSATIPEENQVADFLVPKTASGLIIEANWDTLGMRATRSDDLVLNDVRVTSQAFVDVKEATQQGAAQGWLLHIPACYLGIAMAARQEAIQFAETYKPNSLLGPIKDVPEVKRKIGLMEIELLQARHLMYSVAERWDSDVARRQEMKGELAAVKYVATNAATKVVDLAMRIVGGQSLSKEHHLQRYYRDVRAGIHNPPADDITLSVLASEAFDQS